MGSYYGRKRETEKPDGRHHDDVGEIVEENGADVRVEGIEDRKTVPLDLDLRRVVCLNDRCCNG